MAAAAAAVAAQPMETVRLDEEGGEVENEEGGEVESEGEDAEGMAIEADRIVAESEQENVRKNGNQKRYCLFDFTEH